MKYRKKPVIIEAHQLTVYSLMEICRWMNSQANWKLEKGILVEFIIPTLEGNMEAKEGDYIIKGVKGEFYPCKAEIFHLTYELVEE